MRKIVIIAAMSKEIALLASLLQDKKEEIIGNIHIFSGKHNSDELTIAQSGIGKVCAATATVELIHRFSPDIIINTGAAGSLTPKLKVMDIVVGRQCAYYDVFCGEEEGRVQDFPLYFYPDDNWLKRAASCGAQSAFITSGDRFVSTKSEVEHILDIHPSAGVVDMETTAIAQVCYMYKVPFLSLRIISDTPGVDNHEAQYEHFWETAGEQSFALLQRIIG